jgi:hypothetical protein
MSVMEAVPTTPTYDHSSSDRIVLSMLRDARFEVTIADHRLAEPTIVPLPRRAPVDLPDW